MERGHHLSNAAPLLLLAVEDACFGILIVMLCFRTEGRGEGSNKKITSKNSRRNRSKIFLMEVEFVLPVGDFPRLPSSASFRLHRRSLPTDFLAPLDQTILLVG
jgi:hypothetical protein